jgi:hypothetical protein
MSERQALHLGDELTTDGLIGNPEYGRAGDVALLTPVVARSVAYPPSAAAPKNPATSVSSD